MSRKSREAKPDRTGVASSRSVSPLERAREFMLRLETNGPKLQNAAEELDRLQGPLERAGQANEIRERVTALCDAWSETVLRSDRGRAWLVLVGGFDLKEHVPEVAQLLQDAGLPASLRIHAGHVLAGLGGDVARRALLSVLASPGEAQVRIAAADALAALGDRSVAPAIGELLEEELPRPVWVAASQTYERLC